MHTNPETTSAGKAFGKLKDAKKELLFSELHSLLSAGLDFSRSFRLLIAGEKEKKAAQMLTQLYRRVVQGQPLWKAVRENERFAPLDWGVVRIGEETGRLEETLAFLCDYYRKKMQLRRMISGAVSYPLIILLTALAVVTFMILVIVPMFEQVYARMGGELPAITRMIVRLSDHFPASAGIFTALAVAAAGALFCLRENESLRKHLSALALGIPYLGTLIRKNYQARFCTLLHLLTGAGIPLPQAVEMLQTIIPFYPYRHSFISIGEGLQRGESFTRNIRRYPHLYDSRLAALLQVGEETNRLPQMLRKQGEDLSAELEYRLKALGNLLEPLLILFVGIVVAVILIAMYLPMFALGGIMG